MDTPKTSRRRSVLKILFSTSIASLFLPAKKVLALDEKRLSFYHTHTNKKLEVTYSRGGEYIGSALTEINNFLADFRTGDVTSIDPTLLDFIYDIRESLGSSGTFEVISAYRSPQTNEMLRDRSGGVAKNSQHLLGKAIDVRLDDVDLPKLRDVALAMQRGGVGYYEKSNFVHVDTGRVRRW
jgi:uncharacterized protein YcbK (DUF882 family)